MLLYEKTIYNNALSLSSRESVPFNDKEKWITLMGIVLKSGAEHYSPEAMQAL